MFQVNNTSYCSKEFDGNVLGSEKVVNYRDQFIYEKPRS